MIAQVQFGDVVVNVDIPWDRLGESTPQEPIVRRAIHKATSEARIASLDVHREGTLRVDFRAAQALSLCPELIALHEFANRLGRPDAGREELKDNDWFLRVKSFYGLRVEIVDVPFA